MADKNVAFNLNEFHAVMERIKKASKNADANIRKALIASGYLTINEAKRILLGGTRTGRAYKRGSKIHIASAYGEPAKSDTGNLVSSLNVTTTKEGAIFGALANIAPYAKYLENPKELPDPNRKNRRFLLPAFTKVEPKMIALIDKAIAASI